LVEIWSTLSTLLVAGLGRFCARSA